MTVKNLEAYLGVPKFRRSAIDHEDEIGVAIGMAWTEFGGELLTFEATKVHGKGNFILTGQLGEVMQESAQAAFSYVRGKVFELNIAKDIAKNFDIHIHVPEGATPKEGPVGRDHHRHRHPLAPDRDPGQQEDRHERRDHAAGQGPAGRRDQGEAPGGPPRGDPRGHPAARQQARPEGPAQDPSPRT